MNIILPSQEIPNLTKLIYPLYVQPKFNGKRAVAIGGKLWDINEKELNLTLPSLKNVGGYVLDGVVTDDSKYIVFDCIPLDDWAKKSCNRPYERRISDLRAILNDRVADYNNVIDIPTDAAESPSEVSYLYKNYLTRGYNGVILRSMGGKYIWGRSKLGDGEMLKLESKSAKNT